MFVSVRQLLALFAVTNLKHPTISPESNMSTKDTKKTSVTASARPMIAPKNIVRVDTDEDRRTVITAARAVIKEHRDVIRALAKR